MKTRMKARVHGRDAGVFEGSWIGKRKGGVYIRLFFGGEKRVGLRLDRAARSPVTGFVGFEMGIIAGCEGRNMGRVNMEEDLGIS